MHRANSDILHVEVNDNVIFSKSYPSPDDIAALHLSKLSNFLSKTSRGRFGKQDAKSLKSLAKSSVGVKNTYISIQITQTIAQIELIESQIDDLEHIMEAIHKLYTKRAQ